MVEHLLSVPARRLQGARQISRASFSLRSCWRRCQYRFHDAIEVYDYLLSLEGFDPSSAHGLQLGRAMSLLRDERLYDADRAIMDLRREGQGGIGGPGAGRNFPRREDRPSPGCSPGSFREAVAAIEAQAGLSCRRCLGHGGRRQARHLPREGPRRRSGPSPRLWFRRPS